jgi:hypothetical protein
MKIAYLLLAASLTGLVISGYEKDNQKLTASIIVNPKCKSSDSVSSVKNISDTLSYVSFVYNKSDMTLAIKHINAGFNCCPGKLYCDVSVSGDTLIIKENESKVGCRCNCLYDIDIEVKGVEPKIYQVKFTEPYAGRGDKIIFRADLVNNPEGSFSVTRKQYPWAM